jgi:hypothetical protein
MKPIEPGCLAIITKSEMGNEGKVVGIVRYIGDDPQYSVGNRWEIDRPILGFPQIRCWSHPGHWMMRIDGEDFSHEETEVSEELTEDVNG